MKLGQTAEQEWWNTLILFVHRLFGRMVGLGFTEQKIHSNSSTYKTSGLSSNGNGI